MPLRNYQLFSKHPHVVASYLNLVPAYCGKIVQNDYCKAIRARVSL